MINRATKKRMSVPVAIMYGVKESVADSHYGNNVSMPPGDDDVVGVVSGESRPSFT